MRNLTWIICLVILLPLQGVMADSSSNNPGISKFAQCSRQCVKQNEDCKQKAMKKCGKEDESCLEVCNIAYPDCMAKCPKPGS